MNSKKREGCEQTRNTDAKRLRIDESVSIAADGSSSTTTSSLSPPPPPPPPSVPHLEGASTSINPEVTSDHPVAGADSSNKSAKKKKKSDHKIPDWVVLPSKRQRIEIFSRGEKLNAPSGWEPLPTPDDGVRAEKYRRWGDMVRLSSERVTEKVTHRPAKTSVIDWSGDPADPLVMSRAVGRLSGKFGYPSRGKAKGRSVLPEEAAFMLDMGDAVVRIPARSESAGEIASLFRNVKSNGDDGDDDGKNGSGVGDNGGNKECGADEGDIEEKGDGSNGGNGDGTAVCDGDASKEVDGDGNDKNDKGKQGHASRKKADPLPVTNSEHYVLGGGTGAELLLACRVPVHQYQVFTSLTQRGFRLSRRGFLFNGHSKIEHQFSDPAERQAAEMLASCMYDVWPKSGKGAYKKGERPKFTIFCMSTTVPPPPIATIRVLDKLRSKFPLKMAIVDGDRVSFMGIRLTNDHEIESDGGKKA